MRSAKHLCIVTLLAGVLAACGGDDKPTDKADLVLKRAGPAGEIEVMLCDGETTTQVDPAAIKSREDARRIADTLMAQWLAKNPDVDWVKAETEKHMVVEPADNRHLIGHGQGANSGRITEQDVLMWETETYKLAVRGSVVFHSADELGSQIAVSCDMCHPDGANTHPETYPKFQEQLGRVALLRDMINWCIEHPVRGVPLAADDPKMRALEAYILAQRKGVPLNYGQR